ncbi:uncharacterized protein OCT59_015314 [Rhizophagus irregularis]|uniref:uncharacterized protein n=1 Tax=Rhizophagus irregularis TaxID=588596 RepID=UPI00332AD218|nr:hypothetical protein OCT59_015314 [Rhizophagus irregularis]
MWLENGTGRTILRNRETSLPEYVTVKYAIIYFPLYLLLYYVIIKRRNRRPKYVNTVDDRLTRIHETANHFLELKKRTRHYTLRGFKIYLRITGYYTSNLDFLWYILFEEYHQHNHFINLTEN